MNSLTLPVIAQYTAHAVRYNVAKTRWHLFDSETCRM